MIQLFPVLAQTQYRNRLQGLRNAFNNKETEATDVRSTLVFLAVLAAVIIVVAAIHRLRQSRESRTAPNHPTRLFNQVMKRLGIGYTDRMIMRFLIGRCDLEQPTVIFFNCEYFDRQADQCMESISIKPLQDYSRARIAAVRELVFGGDGPPVAPAGDQA